MLRRLAVLALLSTASIAHADERDCACDLTPAACDAGCACDDECSVDWSIDECSLPGAGCSTPTIMTDAQLDAAEAAQPDDTDVDWATGDVACPAGATGSACTAAAAMTPDTGGCSTGRGAGALAVGAGVVVLLVLARKKRRALIAFAIVACTQDALDWDGAVDDGSAPGDLVDVYAADVGDGAQYVLAHQPLAPGAEQPVAAFALARNPDAIAIARVSLATLPACGDRLVPASKAGDALLGYARAEPGDGTAALVELANANGCFAYETDRDAIDDLVAQGFTELGTLAYVWPPGMTDAPVVETDGVALAAPHPCTITKHSAVELMYASPGADESLRFLVGCPGEVIVGEKRETGPVGSMKSAAAHAAGGRSAFVLDRHGDKLRALLNRANGVERTAAYLRHKLAIGYDYIVLDEVTTAADYADGQAYNHRLRSLLLKLPPRTFIPYLSIDLVQEANGMIYMRDRRLLIRAFKKRARALALEIYLHTPQVMAGAAPATFRRAADRLVAAVHGMPGAAGVSRTAIATIATSMHSSLAQYRYLDEPAHDLDSITRQVNAIRHGGKRLRAEHGIGWYFVNKSDMEPKSHYSYDHLINRMRTQALRFK
jgi:hypothetical protein